MLIASHMRILFVCVHNSGRSQMAEAFVNAFAKERGVDEDWNLEDPAGQPMEKVREIRDEIRRRVEALFAARATDSA